MIITNNYWVYEKYNSNFEINYIEGSYNDVLIKVRDKIHEGYELLTHPLSSSLKPNETPFKSIMISDTKGQLNYNSLIIIENSIIAFEKFNKQNTDFNYTKQILEDFKLIDLTVLESALNK